MGLASSTAAGQWAASGPVAKPLPLQGSAECPPLRPRCWCAGTCAFDCLHRKRSMMRERERCVVGHTPALLHACCAWMLLLLLLSNRTARLDSYLGSCMLLLRNRTTRSSYSFPHPPPPAPLPCGRWTVTTRAWCPPTCAASRHWRWRWWWPCRWGCGEGRGWLGWWEWGSAAAPTAASSSLPARLLYYGHHHACA